MSAPAPERLSIRLFRAGAALAVLVLIGGGAWYGYAALMSRPVAHVQFTGDAERVPPAALEALADSIKRASVGGLGMENVREAAKRVPWVRDASVRRRFPDALEIRIEAFDAVARWGDSAMVSARGEIFPAHTTAKLPLFRGPDGAAAAMAAAYPTLARAIAPVGTITELRLNARGSWQVVLDTGLTLQLGRGEVEARLARFAATWAQLAARHPEPKYADLRHANGFALRKT